MMSPQDVGSIDQSTAVSWRKWGSKNSETVPQFSATQLKWKSAEKVDDVLNTLW
jgi:hypothetical protein